MRREREGIVIQMVLIKKVNGKIICNLDLGKKFGQMVLTMKVTMKMERNMA